MLGNNSLFEQNNTENCKEVLDGVRDDLVKHGVGSHTLQKSIAGSLAPVNVVRDTQVIREFHIQ